MWVRRCLRQARRKTPTCCASTEEKPGGLPLDDPQVRKARAKLFGAWEMNWMAYNYAHDVKLPGSPGAPVAFLMYPQAETGESRRDSLDPEQFRYTITSREIAL